MLTLLFTITRFAHVMTAIVLVGGTVFMRFVLIPSATQILSPDVHDQLRTKVMSIWKRFVHRGIAILLISGAINYWRIIQTGYHKGDGLYHALIGIKIILAFVVFFIASVLVGKSLRFESFRKDAKKWLVINLALATVIVGISGFLRVRDARREAAALAVIASPTAIPAK